MNSPPLDLITLDCSYRKMEKPSKMWNPSSWSTNILQNPPGPTSPKFCTWFQNTTNNEYAINSSGKVSHICIQYGRLQNVILDVVLLINVFQEHWTFNEHYHIWYMDYAWSEHYCSRDAINYFINIIIPSVISWHHPKLSHMQQPNSILEGSFK